MSEIRNFSREKFVGTKVGVRININKFKEWRHGEHTHSFIEIAYLIDGEATQYVDKKKYNQRHGQLMFINYGQVHDFTTKSGTKIIDVLVDPAWISDTLIDTDNAFELLTLSSFSSFGDGIDTSLCHLTFDRDERKVIESILYMMVSEQKNMATNYETALRSLTILLFTHIFRKMSGIQNGFVISPEFLNYIRDNCNSKLTLGELAKMCFYNPSYFSRRFHEHYGITLSDFIQNSRFDKALELLETTDMSADDIAIASGFSSKSGFYKLFKEKTGHTPSEYRKQNKK